MAVAVRTASTSDVAAIVSVHVRSWSVAGRGLFPDTPISGPRLWRMQWSQWFSESGWEWASDNADGREIEVTVVIGGAQMFLVGPLDHTLPPGGVTGGTKVVGYVRVSTDEQAHNGLGLNAQRVAIAQACTERGWELVEIVEDAGHSAKDLNRPGIQRALTMLEGRQPQARALVVAKLDRLSRSLLDFASIMERARRKGWSLAALDLGVDTTAPAGEMVANVMATFAQFERHLIRERTKAALAVKKAHGVRLGRPRTLPDVRHGLESGACAAEA